MTCITCHETHKEGKGAENPKELMGLLRGHSQGRAFCLVCHSQEVLGASWRHSLVIGYAHEPDRYEETSGGSPVDRYSVECLSCHDGVISKLNTAVVLKSGSFQHGIGLTHPVGVEYPRFGREDEFKPVDALPQGIRLFGGKVGCLSCHDPYTGRKGLLSMDNRRSALCLACHNK